MATFNKKGVAPISVTRRTNTVTYENAPSFKYDYKMELYHAVVTTLFGENKFYESGDERAKRIHRLIRRNVESGNAEFVAKLAIYARERMNLRSIPIYLTVVLAQVLRENNNVKFTKMRKLVSRIVQRADELREMFAAADVQFGVAGDNKLFKRQCPKAILKGIADACNKFDAYQFKKYSGGNGTVKFSDILRVVHPKPKDDEQSKIFNMIMTDELPNIDTWETIISNNGSTKENWQSVADNPKTGYMAKLRNLRNFVTHDVDMTNVIAHLTNPIAVEKSKQLPFRFYSAYRELGCYDPYPHNYYGYYSKPAEKTPLHVSGDVIAALEDAFEESIKNLPDLGDDVLIVVDQSGSMQSAISNKSTVLCSEIAAVLGAAVWKNQTVNLKKRAMVVGFANSSKVYNFSNRTTALAAAKEIMTTNLGGSTIVQGAWKSASQAKFKPSTIIVLSDMQMTGGYYDNQMNPEAFNLVNSNTLKISVDIQGYDNTPFAENNGWYQLSGWTEKIFDLIESMQRPGDSIRVIEDDIQF